MDLLKGNVKNIYWGYLAAAFGSSLISSVYSLVDMAMVGKYQGPVMRSVPMNTSPPPFWAEQPWRRCFGWD